MRAGDLLSLSWGALRAHRLRTRMTAAAVAIGVGSVLLLTSLGEGARDWVVGRFASLGSNVLILIPGRTETKGGPPLAPATTRPITLDDALMIPRRVPGVRHVVPIVAGEAKAEYGGRGRAATVVGSTDAYLAIRDISPALGIGLGEVDIHQGARVCVIGHTIRRALFGEANPLGAKVRLGSYPFRVVGVLKEQGYAMMMNVDEIVLVPVASAMKMFNQKGVFRVVVQTANFADLDRVEERVTEVMKERHDGEIDFTVLTPGAIAATLGKIIRMITTALAAIAAVSLAVAGIGVMNVMVVSVTERTAEVGLMKAVGASNLQVLALFLGEAVVLTLFGAALGVAGGVTLRLAVAIYYPAIPFGIPGWSLGLAPGVAIAVGLAFGVIPALRAARMEPVDALRGKL